MSHTPLLSGHNSAFLNEANLLTVYWKTSHVLLCELYTANKRKRIWMNEWMNDTDKWMNNTDKWMNDTDKWINEWTDEWYIHIETWLPCQSSTNPCKWPLAKYALFCEYDSEVTADGLSCDMRDGRINKWRDRNNII